MNIKLISFLFFIVLIGHIQNYGRYTFFNTSLNEPVDGLQYSIKYDPNTLSYISTSIHSGVKSYDFNGSLTSGMINNIYSLSMGNDEITVYNSSLKFIRRSARNNNISFQNVISCKDSKELTTIVKYV